MIEYSDHYTVLSLMENLEIRSSCSKRVEIITHPDATRAKVILVYSWFQSY